MSGLIFFQEDPRLNQACGDPERIAEVLQIEIPAELAGRDAEIRDPLVFDEYFFNSCLGADVIDIVSFLPKGREKRDIGCDMPGGAAAGENDFFHEGCLSACSGSSGFMIYD